MDSGDDNLQEEEDMDLRPTPSVNNLLKERMKKQRTPEQNAAKRERQRARTNEKRAMKRLANLKLVENNAVPAPEKAKPMLEVLAAVLPSTEDRLIQTGQQNGRFEFTVPSASCRISVYMFGSSIDRTSTRMLLRVDKKNRSFKMKFTSEENELDVLRHELLHLLAV